MKATVLVNFRDKFDHKVIHVPGEDVDFDNDRVVALAARGLVEIHKEESETPAETPVAEPIVEEPKKKGRARKSAADNEQ